MMENSDLMERLEEMIDFTYAWWLDLLLRITLLVMGLGLVDRSIEMGLGWWWLADSFDP